MTPPGWHPMRAAARRSLVLVNARNRCGIYGHVSEKDLEGVQHSEIIQMHVDGSLLAAQLG